MSEQWPGESPEDDEEAEPEAVDEDDEEPELRVVEHHDGIEIPPEVELLEGEPRSTRRGVGIVASRASETTANALLQAALDELEKIGVGREHVTVMLVPGPCELAIGAMALAKTRRYSCIVALGDATESSVVAAEAASGLQLAGLETGIPVSFGVLVDAGDAVERGAEAVRRALEMADLFQQLRASVKAV
jgi:6,7-dimethyl-8-ribityllumazine synthase